MEKYEEVLVAYDKVEDYWYGFHSVVRSRVSINGKKRDLSLTNEELRSYIRILEDYKPCHKRVSAGED